MDVAKLVFDFDATSATAAERQVDSLEKTTGRLEQTSARLKGSFGGGAFEQARSSAGAYQQSLNSLIGVYGQARDALGRFAQEDGKYRMSQDATAKVILQNARTVEAFNRQQEQAAKAASKAAADAERDRRAEMDATAAMLIRNAKLQDDLTRQQEQAAATTASYAAKVAGLKAQLDPFAAVQLKLAQNTKLLDEALAHGAITGKQYEDMLSRVTRSALSDVQALDRLQKAHGGAGEAAKLQSYQLLNLGRNAADVFVQLSSGQGVMMTLIQQGPQIADVFAEAKTQGVGFKAAIAGIVAEFGPFLAVAAPVAAIVGLLALGVKRASDLDASMRSFNAQLALNSDGLSYNAQALTSTARGLSDYGVGLADARAGLATFIRDGVDPAKLQDFSLAARNLSDVLGGDLKKAQEDVSTAFTGGYAAVAKLDDELNFLTAAQREHIRAMDDAGKSSEAQDEAFRIFAGHVDEAADKARGPWQDAIRGLTGAWSDFLDNLAGSDAIQSTVRELSTLIGVAQGAIKLVDDYNKGQKAQTDQYLGSVAAKRPRDASGMSQSGNLFQRLRWGELPLDVLLDPTDEAGKELRRRQTAARTSAVAPGSGSGVNQRDAKESADRLSDLLKKVDQPNALTAALGKFHSDITTAKAAGLAVPSAAQQKQIEEQLRKQFEPVSTLNAAKGASAALRALRLDDTTQDALDRAQKAELAAQQALTQNIDLLAGYRKQQIEQEADAARANVDREVAAKKLDAATAPAIKAAIDRTEALKKQAIDQQYAAQQVDKEIQQRAVLAGFSDRALQAEIGMAASLEEAQALENKALADQQARESKDALARQRIDISTGKIDAAQAVAANTAMMDAQAAQRALKARQDRLAIFQRDLELARQGYQNELDILGSRKSLAQSSYEASQFDRQIATVRYQAERDNLERTLANKDANAVELEYARNRLPVIEEIYRNELRQLELSNNAVTAYADLVGALSNAARSIIDGDIGGSISAAGGVLRQLSGLAGSGSALGASLATAASYAGPIGAAVSAVTGVLGAIGASSAAKAQAKIERLTKAVEDLRTDNKTSSGSIAAALAEANANWNSDLEYSSAMLTALRSIDAKTGAAAALLARQVSTGGLLSTNGLGLGSSSSQGSIGAGLGAAGLTGAALAGGTSLLMGGFAGALALGPMGLVAGAVGALVGALTKTKTTVDVLDQGLQFTAATFDQIAAGGVTGSTYADLLTTTKKSLLGVGLSTKVKTSTVNGSINSDLLSQISGVVQALGDGVLSAASVFGVEAAKAAEAGLGKAVVDLGKLSLKDLKPDEIAEVLNATFDKVGDQLAAAGVPGLDALGQVGEGAFETLTRVAREYQVVDIGLQSIGKTFGAVGLESIAARDALVQLLGGVDDFTSKTSFFAQNFLTDAERLAPIQKAVNDNLAAYGLSATSSRDAFKALVLAQDLTTEAGRDTYAALLNIAPAFDKVASAAEDLTAKATAAAKERADFEAGIQAKIDDLTLTDAQKRERELAAALAVSDKAAELTKQLWALADAADKAAKETQDAADAAALQASRQSALADLFDAQGRTEEAKALRRAQTLAAITDPMQRAYQEWTYAATDAAERVSAARDVLTEAYNREKSVIDETRSKWVDLAKTLRGSLDALSSKAVDALDPLSRTAVTQRAFEDVAMRAKLGDSEAAAKIPQLGEDFRSALEASSGSQIEYLKGLSYIRRATEEAAETADRQVSVADRQLEALNASVAGLIQVNQSVISVQEAIVQMNAAQAAARAAGVVSAGGQAVGGTGLSTNPTSPAGANAQMAWILTHSMAGSGGAGLGGADPAYVALGNAYKPSFSDVAGLYGVQEAVRQQQAGLLKFATGGVFTNGIVSQPTTFDMGMMGEAGPEAIVPLVQGPEGLGVRMSGGSNDNSALIAELQALRREVVELKAASIQTTLNTSRTSRQLERWDGDGLPPERDVA